MASSLAGSKPGNPFPDAVHAAFQPAAQVLTPINTSVKANSSLVPTGQAPNYNSLAGLEGFGDVLQPTSASGRGQNGQTAANSKAAFTNSTGAAGTGLFKGDLDSTLANLAQNLTFESLSKK